MPYRLKMLPDRLNIMKNRAKLLVLLAIGIVAGTELFAQCTPDPACEDIGDPGQFCPLDLPKGVIDTIYDETVTVIPPGTFEFLGSVWTILYIEIDSVKNMPPGIDYFPNEDTLYPETAYCIQLTGTPTETGVFAFDIYVSATVDFDGTPTKANVVDDSSIVITVQETAGINPNQETGFRVFRNVPNPFAEVTRLGFFTPFDDRIELNVYNVLGVLVHHELEAVPPGEHSFRFDGSALQPGTYFYRVTNSETSFSGKLVKSR
jgi:hypothetical protein